MKNFDNNSLSAESFSKRILTQHRCLLGNYKHHLSSDPQYFSCLEWSKKSSRAYAIDQAHHSAAPSMMIRVLSCFGRPLLWSIPCLAYLAQHRYCSRCAFCLGRVSAYSKVWASQSVHRLALLVGDSTLAASFASSPISGARSCTQHNAGSCRHESVLDSLCTRCTCEDRHWPSQLHHLLQGSIVMSS